MATSATPLVAHKRKRKVFRAAVTRIIGSIKNHLNEEPLDEETLVISLQQLTIKGEELAELDNMIEPLVLELDEENYEIEIEEVQKYRAAILEFKTRVEFHTKEMNKERRSRRNSVVSQADSTASERFEEPTGGEIARGRIEREPTFNGGERQGERPARWAPSVRLPKLEIKRFSGDIMEWQNFWSVYETTIHLNPQLDNIEKFSYLKSYLEGEAALSIKGLTNTVPNYETAIRNLKNRYGQEDVIIDNHMYNLINLTPVRKAHDVSALRKLHDTCEIEIRSLESVGIALDTFGALLCPVLIKLVPKETALMFTRMIGPQNKWTARDFLNFLSREIASMERAFTSQTTTMANERATPDRLSSRSGFAREPKHPSTAAALNTVVSDRICIFCENPSHSTNECKHFTPEERRDIIQRKRRCFICLREHHRAKFCRARIKNCKKCNKRHHHTLCFEGQENSGSLARERAREETSRENPPPPPVENTAALSTITHENQRGEIFLKTAQALVKGGGSNRYRCLLDGASHRTFINAELSRKLQLPVVGEETLEIFPFESETPIYSTRRKIQVDMISIHDPKVTVRVIALETPEVNGAVFAVPSQIIAKEMNRRGLLMADDPKVNEEIRYRSSIDIMIGADYFWEVVTGRTEMLGKSLAAMETRLGWVVHGRTATRGPATVSVNSVAVMLATVPELDPVSEQLQSFWDIETLGINDSRKESLSENEVLEQLESMIEFHDGRYKIGFPWNEKKSELGDNLANAKTRTMRLLSKLEQEPLLLNEYNKVIKDQLQEGVIELVPENEDRDSEKAYFYLPHRHILRESSSTPLRVVHDASSHPAGRPSLNDCMESGPNLNAEIIDILLRFREKEIAFTADIQKAFLQIALKEEDQDCVRFLWINVNEVETPFKLRTYRIKRVPFGVTASPCLLAFTVRHHVKKYEEAKPEVKRLIDQQLYVDDLLGGEDDVEKALELSKSTADVLLEGGMHLRKWNTNSVELRELWQQNGLQQQNLENDTPLKILGMSWDAGKDLLNYDSQPLLQYFSSPTMTKRGLIQAVARIYDPLGLLAPYTIRGKMMFQVLWERGLTWDDELPQDLASQFDSWCEELTEIKELKIPRFYYREASTKEIISRQLHCFVDASEKAYAATVYLRYEDSAGKVTTCLVTSKTRVAPIKKLTIPRLELMAAVIGARLVTHVSKTLTNKPTSIHLWSDSTITLQWIKGSASRWKPFVSNRVREIQELTDPQLWKHCRGDTNPADLPSRGIKMRELVESKLWWFGPPWLRQEYQNQAEPLDLRETPSEALEEERRSVSKDAIAILVASEGTEDTLLDLNRFSNHSRLNRTVAWVHRFIHNCRNPQNRKKGELSAEEITQAEHTLIKNAQGNSFPEEVASLKKGDRISVNSKIYTLSPFLDPYGLLRIGGRLDQTKFSYEEKHPWLLSSKHQLSELIVRGAHNRIMHGGANETIVEVRERFWIPKARQLVKKTINNCYKCKRFRAKPSVATMASLPADRVTRTPPFETCGLDYAGPLYTKSGTKSYIALFTCAVTRAVHLELVSDLTTENFLLAFRRFISRRGIVRHVFSDNAKTFKRANEDLKILAKTVRSPEVQNFAAEHRIKWTFITERAPWVGGFWERMVKSTKNALRKVLGTSRLTYEEIETVLTEAEAIVNSRPLSFVYNEADEPAPLTPAHFLVGGRLTSLPSQSFPTSVIQPSTRKDLTKRLRYRQTLLDQFWRRWKADYLLDLRSAHHQTKDRPTRTLKDGDVVLIEEPRTPRLLWKLARVKEAQMGRDGQVRSCLLKLPDGTEMRRPIKLLYFLELDEH